MIGYDSCCKRVCFSLLEEGYSSVSMDSRLCGQTKMTNWNAGLVLIVMAGVN